MSRQRTFFALALMSLFLSFPALAERMLVTSDLHLTMETALHTPALKALGEAGRDCDVLLFLGDDTNNAHDEEHRYFLNTLEAYKRLTDAEIYVLPGNHDLSGRLGPQEFAKLYHAWGYEGALSRDEASASYAVLTAGGTCLLMMDTNAYTDLGTVAGKGGIGESTIAWAESVLSGLPEGTPVVACGHHPLLPPESRYETTNCGLLASVFEKAGVSLYLCGHDHGFAAVRGEKLQQITIGQPHAFPGWAGILEVDAEEMRWQVISLYETGDPYYQTMEENSIRLGLVMAESALKDTQYEGDAGAAAWFTRAFNLMAREQLTPDICQELLADPNADKWREIEPRSVVKRWMMSVLENCPMDPRSLTMRFSDAEGEP